MNVDRLSLGTHAHRKRVNKLKGNEIATFDEEQIIKALECSPLNDIGGCRKIDALDLIKRQKAEIERLKNAYKQCAWERDAFLEETKTAKAERCIDLKKQVEESAINRLAEKLKEYYPSIAKGVDYTVEEVLKD